MSQQKKLAGNAADKSSHSRWRKLWNAEIARHTDSEAAAE